jgi:hypothetical protein
MKYTVHLYKVVRITTEGIEANSQEEAARIADEQCDVAESLRVGAAEGAAEMSATKHGDQATCKYCGQDIEFHGRKHGWVDRGNNRQCCPHIKNGEIINPKTKHAKEAEK